MIIMIMNDDDDYLDDDDDGGYDDDDYLIEISGASTKQINNFIDFLIIYVIQVQQSTIIKYMIHKVHDDKYKIISNGDKKINTIVINYTYLYVYAVSKYKKSKYHCW